MTVISDNSVSQRRAAVITGISLLVMTAAAMFAYGYVHGSLVMQDNPGSTLNNIAEAQTLFRSGILGWMIIIITDITAAWGLYIFFRQTDRSIALLSAWFRFFYAGILGIAVSNLIFILILTDTDYLTSVPHGQAAAETAIYITAFSNIWDFGLILFGIHLLLLGILALKSDYTPTIFGIILLLASAGYLVMKPLHILFPGSVEAAAGIESILNVLAMGEVVFGIWLLIKGGKSVK